MTARSATLALLRFVFVVVLFSRLVAGTAHAQTVEPLPELVGAFGDPTHLIFQGDSPFTDAQLRHAVQGDLQLAVSSSPSCELKDYLSILRRRLRDGFRRAGFYHPSINISREAATNHLVVNLDLGRRWQCGKVIVRGANTIPVDELTKRLTQPTSQPFFQSTVTDNEISVTEQPDSADSTEAAQWVPGDHAPFDDYRPDELTSFIRQQLATMGYLHPFFRVSVEPGNQDADLVVNLIDEGPRAILHHIDFQTLGRNSPEAVRDLLKIKPGDPVDLNRIYAMQRTLWDSGRFIRHTILVQRIPGDDARVVLVVKLKEAENVPLLTEPLSDTDRALQRFGRWCLTAGDDGNDVLIKTATPDYETQWAWGGVRGTACTLRIKNGVGASLLGDDRAVNFFISNKMAGIYLPLAGLKLEGPYDRYSVHINLNYGPDPDPDAKRPWSFRFNASLNQPGDSPQPSSKAIQVDRWIAPVALLAEAREQGHSCRIEGPTLVMKGNGFSMRIDAASGRLLEADTTGENQVDVCVQAGALESMQQSMRKSPGINMLAMNQPVASCYDFLTQAFFHSGVIAPKATTQQRHRLAEIAGRVLDAREFDQVDNMFSSLFPIFDTNQFYLPIDKNLPRPQGMAAMGAICGLTINDRLFAARSWPWTVGRCGCFAICNLTDTINPELQRLFASPETGPLASLAVAELARQLSPEHSRIFARSGLVKLSPEMFAKDCQALFNGNPQATAMAMRLAENLRSLSNDDVEAVATQLPAAYARAVPAAIIELKAHDGPVDQAAIAAALAKAWDGGLRETVEDELNRLAAQ